jgi:hypothetical protein
MRFVCRATSGSGSEPVSRNIGTNKASRPGYVSAPMFVAPVRALTTKRKMK